MRLLQILHLLLLFTFYVNVVNGNTLCASLHESTTFKNDEQGCHFTVAASIHIECANFEDNVDFVKIFKGSLPGLSASFCRISFKDNKCSSAVGCVCNNDTGIFSVTKQMTSSFRKGLLLMGVLRDGDTFHTTVKFHPEDCAKASTLLSSGTSITDADSTPDTSSSYFASDSTPDTSSSYFASGVSTTTTELRQTTTGGEGSGDSLKAVSILGGVVGFVLLVVAVLSVCVGVLFWKRGRSRRLPAPPPAPHNVRRAVHRGSKALNKHSHDYVEILDNVDLNMSESSLASVHSISVSDSSLSDDCLHHIACPSSDSSLPEDYLNPVASALDVVATIKDEDSISSSSSEAVMYANERITFSKKCTKKIITAQVEPPVKKSLSI